MSRRVVRCVIWSSGVFAMMALSCLSIPLWAHLAVLVIAFELGVALADSKELS